jgi:cell cycle related kinase
VVQTHFTYFLQGETDIAQLAIVIATLGTPNDEVWPSLTSLPDYNKIAFTHSDGQPWEEKFQDCDEHTVDVIGKILQYDHNRRLEAKKVTTSCRNCCQSGDCECFRL